MPNWCHNYLTVEGGRDQLRSFFDQNKTTEQPLSFNRAVSEPEGLHDRPVNHGIARLNSNIDDNQLDWYSWRVKYWGTKWDANFDMTEPEETVRFEDHLIYYSFVSAWGPPDSWLVRVSEGYPKITFELAYAEPGNDFAGRVRVKAGNIVEQSSLTVEEVLDASDCWF